jgi:hypothetical protein
MRQASKRVPDSAEKTVRDIRRATRRHHSAEEKIRIVLGAARTALLSCAARKGSTKTSTTAGRKSWEFSERSARARHLYRPSPSSRSCRTAGIRLPDFRRWRATCLS